jgi:uncharacterized membrane protein YgaE (UPF0421/DUF939 family)
VAFFDINEAQAIRRLIQAQRPTTRQSVVVAAMFSVQVSIATGLLFLGYHIFGLREVLWAIVSAVLVIQPGVQQALGATAVRVAANIVGACSGLAVNTILGHGHWQVVVAMILVVVICELFHLDVGLRTACVSSVIVMMVGEQSVVHTGLQRMVSVLVGCITGLLVQLAVEQLRRRIKWFHDETADTPVH